LLAVLAFGFGGTSGLKDKSHTDALCTKGVIFVVRGSTIKQTLMLNLGQYQSDPFSIESDNPVWEMDDPMWERSAPLGLLDHYTYPSRSIKLYLDPKKLEKGELVVYKYRLGLGLRTDDILDPMKHYFKKSSGLLPLAFDEDRQIWRNSISLFEINPVSTHPPVIFSWLSTLVEAGILERQVILQCKALGIAKNRGRADFAREEQFPLPLSLLANDKKLALLRDAIDRVERTSSVLDSALALTSMYLHIDDPKKYQWKKKRILHLGAEKDIGEIKTTEKQILDWMMYTGTERHYWAALDVPFLGFMERLGIADEDTLLDVNIEWQDQVRESAHTAFRQVLQYTNQTPRAFKAFAHGNNRLQSYLDKNFLKGGNT